MNTWEFVDPDIRRRFELGEEDAIASQFIQADKAWYPATSRFFGALSKSARRIAAAIENHNLIVRTFGDPAGAREYLVGRTRIQWDLLLPAHDRFMNMVSNGETIEQPFYDPNKFTPLLLAALIIGNADLVARVEAFGLCAQMEWRERIDTGDCAGYGALLLGLLTEDAQFMELGRRNFEACMDGQRRYKPMKAVLDLANTIFDANQDELDRQYPILESAYLGRKVDPVCYGIVGAEETEFDLISSLLLRLATRRGMQVAYDSPTLPAAFIHFGRD